PQVVAQQLQIQLDKQAVSQGLEPMDCSHADCTTSDSTDPLTLQVGGGGANAGTPYGGNAAQNDQAFEIDITPTVSTGGVFTISATSGNFVLSLTHGGMTATTSPLTVGASSGVVQAAL